MRELVVNTFLLLSSHSNRGREEPVFGSRYEHP